MPSAWDRRAIASTPSLIYSTRFTRKVLPAHSSWMQQAKSGESDRIFPVPWMHLFFFSCLSRFLLAMVVTAVSRYYDITQILDLIASTTAPLLSCANNGKWAAPEIARGGFAGAPDQQPA